MGKILWLLILLLSSASSAQTWKWRGGLPAGTAVNAAVWNADGSRYFLATHGRGVLMSEDGGESWAVVNQGLTHLTVLTLQVHPHDPTRLWIGTTGGVYLSVDQGESWQASNTGLTHLQVRHLALSANAPSTLLAATNGGVFRSDDGGKSWQAKGLGNVWHLAQDPIQPETWYAATFGSGVHRSQDGGKTWNPLGGPQNVRQVLAVRHAGDRILLASSAPPDVFGAVTIHRYAAEAWTSILQSSVFSDLALDSHNGTVHIAAARARQDNADAHLISLDAGQTWKKASTVNQPICNAWRYVEYSCGKARRLAFHPTREETHLWMDYGLLRSNDQPAWSGVYNPLTGSNLLSLAYAQNEPERIYAIPLAEWDLPPLRSPDGGATWSGKPSKAFPESYRLIATVDIRDTSHVIVSGIDTQESFDGTKYLPTFLGNVSFVEQQEMSNTDGRIYAIWTFGTLVSELRETRDFGRTWTVLASIRGYSPLGLVADGESVGVSLVNFDIANVPPSCVVARSTDGGLSWNAWASPCPQNIRRHLQRADWLFGVGFGSQIVRSRDGGLTWQTVLPSSGDAVHLDVAADGRVLVASRNRVQFSRDGGESWQTVAADLGVPITSVRGLPQERIALTTLGAGLWLYGPAAPYRNNFDRVLNWLEDQRTDTHGGSRSLWFGDYYGRCYRSGACLGIHGDRAVYWANGILTDLGALPPLLEQAYGAEY